MCPMAVLWWWRGALRPQSGARREAGCCHHPAPVPPQSHRPPLPWNTCFSGSEDVKRRTTVISIRVATIRAEKHQGPLISSKDGPCGQTHKSIKQADSSLYSTVHYAIGCHLGCILKQISENPCVPQTDTMGPWGQALKTTPSLWPCRSSGLPRRSWSSHFQPAWCSWRQGLWLGL